MSKKYPKEFLYGLHVGEHGFIPENILGELKTNCQSRIVFVTAESDLANLPEYAPGTLAATYGLDSVWQLDDSGTWVEV